MTANTRVKNPSVEQKTCSRFAVLRVVTKAAGVLDEAMHHGCLQLEPLLHIGIHLVCGIAGVEKVRRQHDGQVAAVHLVLGTPGEKKTRLTNWT